MPAFWCLTWVLFSAHSSWEHRAEDALGAGAVAAHGVAALGHEALDDAVQPDSFVMHGFAGLDAVAALAGAEGPEVLARSRECGGEELELHAPDVLLRSVLGAGGFELHEDADVLGIPRDSREWQLQDGHGLQVLHELHRLVHEEQEAEEDAPDGQRVPAGVCGGGGDGVGDVS
jgi:hypothetical protein